MPLFFFFQSLRFINVLQEVQIRFCEDSKSEKSDPKLPSRWPNHASGRPSEPRSFELFQGCIRPDVLVTRLDTHQCSTRNQISFSDTDMGRQLHSSRRQGNTVRMLSLIRQDVEKNCNRLDVWATLSKRQSLLWKLRVAKVQPSGP
jgi:hypothetical protein